MIRATAVLACVLGACQDPAAGTFVGNPDMTARIADNPVQRAESGIFDALEVHFTDCDDTIVPLGHTVFTFDGPDAEEVVDIPAGVHCGLFFVVDDFVVTFEEQGAGITVIADDFDLAIPAEFAARDGGHYVLQFGDEAWLSEVASLAGPGENRLDGSNPALDQAFFDGLVRGSTVLNAGPGDTD